MNCPQCGTENPEGARFCLNCVTRLVLVCAECETELPPHAKFCFNCGAPVGAPPVDAPTVGAPPTAAAKEPGGPGLDKAIERLIPAEYAERLLATRGQVARERRTVTILFSDVKDSTALAEKLDPEDWLEIMDGAFDVLIEPVYRYEGTVARLMGDAVLAFFGAPIAHEDDAERACRAALEIVEGAGEYATRLERDRGIQEFNVRVGINTGLVVVGEVGSDLRVEYTAMGDAINLAARMESAAEPGTVLITEDTRRLIASLFETEALVPIEVKGREEPVPVYRVLAAKAAPGKPRGISGLESPLVGREVEFAAVREAVERLQKGAGGIVTLVGEAGIGKSRLVAEVRKQTLAKVQKPSQGWPWTQWVEGRCLSYGASIAYLLWLDVLRGLLGVSLDDAPAEVEGVLRARVEALCVEHLDTVFDPVEGGVKDAVYPYLGRLMSLPLEEEVEGRLDDLDGRTLRDCTFWAIETLLACTAQKQPLVVVCEDLHWADPTSLRLLEHLFPLSDRLPLLFVCVFRPVRDHPVWQLRETLAQDGAYAHRDLWLEPLSAADSQELVTSLLWIEDLPPALKERILARAEGNPFYLEEILRSLIDQAAIVQDRVSGRWQAMADVERIAIPGTLEGVLVARIDRLQEETRRVLQLASVIGRIFLYRVLAEIAAAEAAAYEELALDRRLETLQREELIRERARLPELEYIFKHDLTREAAYNGLLKRDRRTYHRQVAEALERLFPERVEEQVGLLAHHWERAGDAEQAVEYLLRAGDQARLAYAHEEAVDYYQRALAFLEGMEDHERAARTLMKLGLTHDSAFDFQRGREAYQAGFALWQRATLARPAVALPPAPHALRVAGSSPTTIDPGLCIEDDQLIQHLFSGLVDHTPELGIVPDVAARWHVLDGGRRYVFHLRDDVRWSDGRPVTAHDFDYAWKRLLAPATASLAASGMFDIKGARAFHEGSTSDPGVVGVWASDDWTLVVDLEAPCGYFLHVLSTVTAYPVPRHAVEKWGPGWTEPGHIVTNGPFRLEAWHQGESVVLSRNPRYHGRFGGNVERVGLTLFPERPMTGAAELYEADLLDWCSLDVLAAEEKDRLRRLHAEEYVSLPRATTGYVAFDVRRAPFEDPRVRRAFAQAVDREALVGVTLGGYYFPATGGFVSPGTPGHVPGVALPYDPARARELLAEAGYRGGSGFPPVEFLTTTAQHAHGRHLSEQWRENLGVPLRGRELPWAEYLPLVHRDPPHIFYMGWHGDHADPDGWLRVAVQLHTAWRPRRYLDLVERARRSTDQEERMRLYAQVERLLAEEVPLLPLTYNRMHMLVKPWVRRYPVSVRQEPYWKEVILEPH